MKKVICTLILITCLFLNGYAQSRSDVTLTEKKISMPTYTVRPADKNPYFFRGEGYQGASRHYYPHYTTTENEDGSKTVWIAEYEPRHGMRRTIGVTVFPGKSYFKTEGRIHNSSPPHPHLPVLGKRSRPYQHELPGHVSAKRAGGDVPLQNNFPGNRHGVFLGYYSTAKVENARVLLKNGDKVVFEKTVTIAPDLPFTETVRLEGAYDMTDLHTQLINRLTGDYTRPSSCEALYLQGLTLRSLGLLAEADDLNKAIELSCSNLWAVAEKLCIMNYVL